MCRPTARGSHECVERASSVLVMNLLRSPPRDDKAQPVLLVWPAVPAWQIGGEIWLDRKLYDGLCCYATNWPGKLRVVTALVRPEQESKFGAVLWAADSASFQLDFLADGEVVSAGHLSGVSVLLASADNHLALNVDRLCRRLNVVCVYDIEYTLSTRLDMNWLSGAPTLRRLRTAAWLVRNELRLRRALRSATAVQANGLPAFNLYAKGHSHGLLYFDSRVTARECITHDRLRARLQYLSAGKPLRLAFSGRLIRAKGADALVPLARRLRDQGFAFSLDIFGAGELEPAMKSEIAALQLGNSVRLRGAVDFQRELLPFIQDNIDVFVSCHRQGDPSCTYLETYACGVPIAGFANEAHQAILGNHDVGWAVGVDDLDGLAALICRLGKARDELSASSERALTFAAGHLFDKTFSERTKQAYTLAMRRSPWPEDAQ